MSKVIKIKKGLDIKLKGTAEKVTVQVDQSALYAIKPLDFVGLTPKMCARPGDSVKVGTPVFFDKYRPSIQFVSPVAGVLKEVVRGERRRILEVVIEAQKEPDYEEFSSGNPAEMAAETVRETLLKSGLWPALVQRPYGIVADPDVEPKAIFISGFDSAPLGVDYDVILKDQEENVAAGVAALQKLTKGKVHLSLEDGFPVSKSFANLKGVEYHTFNGPHPSGLVGIQIHHISPINKGDIYWTISPQHLCLIGRLFLSGKLGTDIVVAVAGSLVSKPRYVRTNMGVSLIPVLKDQLAGDSAEARVVSGNVLTGTLVEPDGYLGFYDSLVSVIPEGKYYELFGWVMPGLNKFSNSRTFLTWLRPKKIWDIDTNLKGGKRAFVMSGQYEKVLPMDVLPVHLLKAILADDIDKMEQLGIYEVIEEDLALCEFVCTSKIEAQSILREGLDLMRKEMS
ncbi:MAG: Na(+)-translocating NADH-quinone reductase subunit A [Bacteroidales bacterium]|nr:Na(+)-translocating NADH-quinone reductase subunit A [Bacteroidales bacterium]